VNVIAEIVSLSGYEFQVSALLDEEARMAMESYIALAPEGHPVIPGAGGFRKACWARRGKGKSGGLRVGYFFLAGPDFHGLDLRQIAKGDPFGGPGGSAAYRSSGLRWRASRAFG
jgi:hypothetical protein